MKEYDLVKMQVQHHNHVHQTRLSPSPFLREDAKASPWERLSEKTTRFYCDEDVDAKPDSPFIPKRGSSPLIVLAACEDQFHQALSYERAAALANRPHQTTPAEVVKIVAEKIENEELDAGDVIVARIRDKGWENVRLVICDQGEMDINKIAVDKEGNDFIDWYILPKNKVAEVISTLDKRKEQIQAKAEPGPP